MRKPVLAAQTGNDRYTRAEPRFTRDVDVAVTASDDSAAGGLVRSLLMNGNQLIASVEHDATGCLATARLASTVAGADDVVVDVLFASSGIEPEIVAAAEPIEIISGVAFELARTSVDLITRRGFHRDRDLAAALQQLLR